MLPLTSHYYFPPTNTSLSVSGPDWMEELLQQFHAVPVGRVCTIGKLSDHSVSGRFAFIVQGNNGGLSPEVWNLDHIDYITPLDSLYTFPSWDWWIEPIFPRDLFQDKRAHLIVTEHSTPDTVKEVLSSLARLGANCVRIENLDAPIGLEGQLLVQFRYVLLDEMLAKLAGELNRIRALTIGKEFESCVFILRGGFFVRKVLEAYGPSATFHYLNLNEESDIDERFGDPERTLFIDDAIGMARSLELIVRRRKNLPLHFASLDAAFPLNFYQLAFPSVNFYLPTAKLNIYGCRLFEDNPEICGVDIGSNGQIKYYDNQVREKFVRRVLTEINSLDSPILR